MAVAGLFDVGTLNLFYRICVNLLVTRRESLCCSKDQVMTAFVAEKYGPDFFVRNVFSERAVCPQVRNNLLFL